MPLMPPQGKSRKDKPKGGGISEESVATTNATIDESNAISGNTARSMPPLMPSKKRLVMRLLVTVALVASEMELAGSERSSLSFRERHAHHRRYSRSDADAREAGVTLPSEKLNQLSECGQSEYKRAEISILILTPNLPHVGVKFTDVLEALGTGASIEILLQNVSGSGACSAVPT